MLYRIAHSLEFVIQSVSVELHVLVSLVGYIRGTFQARPASQTRAVVKR